MSPRLAPGASSKPLPSAGGGLFAWMAGGANEWMGPGAPVAPNAPETAGRAWDYPVAYNMRQTPKDEGVTFTQLRNLADGYDLLRLAVETRKDQMDGLVWAIKGRGKKDGGKKAESLQDFLLYPDREHTWYQWVRMLMEEMLVLDAPVVYPRKTKGGQLFSLDIVAGDTIKRLLDASGRTPMEGPAYQQVLKGIVASEFTRDELLYMPRNVRANRVYGFSPVEQVIATVNIALRRQLHQLTYYSEGSKPNLIFSVPKDWSPSQLDDFQSRWDSLLSGNEEMKARTRFVPDGVKPFDTKEQALKDAYDEWLARIICYAFSLSPLALVQQMNRSTAETAQETAQLEGLRPLQNWWKGLMDKILRDVFQEPSLEFVWESEEEIDPEVKSRIHVAYTNAGILTVDEVREQLGREALPEEPDPEPPIAPVTPPPAPGDPPSPPSPRSQAEGVGTPQPKTQQAEEEEPSGKCACGTAHKARPKAINRRRPAALKAERQLGAAIKKLFRRTAVDLAGQIDSAIRERFGKADGAISDEDLDWIIGKLNLEGWTSLSPKAKGIIERLARDGGAAALEQIGVNADRAEAAAMLNQVNERALEWADTHSAELVTRISDTTREGLRSDIREAIEQGLSTDDIADALSEAYSFSDARAEMIARTETAFADVKGNVLGYEASGQVEALEWLVSSEGGCPICEANLNAVVSLGGTFPSGDQMPPAHPHCICDVVPVLKEEAQP